MKARIFEIKRFAVHDGDGIRTTVFFKGCPLKCLWCHNPEGINYNQQLAYYEYKCISCGRCVKTCENNAHIFKDGKHVFIKDNCKSCGKCESVCLGNALKFYGRDVTVEELLPVLLADKDFYDNSGGGVTLSGGECMMQTDFCVELMKKLKSYAINTAVDTCGFTTKENLDKLIPYTDVFLYDIKGLDEKKHIENTEKSNSAILDNILYLDSIGAKIEVRIPYIPRYNDSEMENIAKFLSGIKNLTKVRILPYHNLAGSKYDSLGMKNTLPKTLPTIDEIQNVKNIFKDKYDLNVF